MNLRINLLIGLVIALFFSGAIYLTWYVTKKQTTQADVPLLPAATTSQLGALSNTTENLSSKITDTTESSNEQVTLQLSNGYNLVSFGHLLAPSNCRNLFSGLSARDVSALRQGKWESCFTGTEWSSVPGESYFVRSEKGENLKIPVTATPVSLKDRFTFDLVKGWNAVGNPFPNKSFIWRPEVVFDNQTFTFKEALDKKFISNAFWYNPLSKAFEELKEGDTVPANRGLVIQAPAKGQLIILAPGE